MLINNNKKIVFSTKEKICRTHLTQMLGLMFRKRQNLVMIFPSERKISLHMLMVFYPIDVLLLNEQREVIEIKRAFQPFSFWNSDTKAMYVIELGDKDSREKARCCNVGDSIKIPLSESIPRNS
ncbi:MAG TPA: DUF192 domain-containing protein [Candidatus Nanoarchaeia archaeon]|nr:DUF192 domain-containing protein [Candidatus Nanoarchaeia archaeon]